MTTSVSECRSVAMTSAITRAHVDAIDPTREQGNLVRRQIGRASGTPSGSLS